MRSKRKYSDGDSLTFRPTEGDLDLDIAVTQHLSEDGRRVHQDELHVAPVSPTLNKRPRYDEGSDWIGRGFEDAFDDAGDEGAEDVRETLDAGKKKDPAKRYIKSDRPHLDWLPRRNAYFDEVLRLEGRRGYSTEQCPFCDTGDDALYRCKDCFSRGELMCKTCCLSRHQENPLHVIQEWNGHFFGRTSLTALGFVVQLGHSYHQQCSNPHAGHKKFTVVHTNGLHYLNVQFCECMNIGAAGTWAQQLLRCEWYPATDTNPRTCCTFRVLEHYHLQTLQGKIAPYDYYSALEKLTDNLGGSPKLARYKEFTCCTRQWRHMKMLKRAGRGHDNRGVDGTKPGELAVVCTACPCPGINLPDGWEDADEETRFLYILYIAMDACFRLKRRIVSSHAKDPSLSQGNAYFTEEGLYRKHLLKYTDQVEMNTCSGLSALDHANTKFSRGYSSTGIGICVCARHEFVQATGAGDLQKGERFANMDYIHASAQRHHDSRLRRVTSYDITCAWMKYLWDRMNELPPHLKFNFPASYLKFVIPKLHIYSHKVMCHVLYSFNLLPGAGMTDGESVERSHSKTGGAAASTVECGPGLRWDILNDLWGFQNFTNMVGMGTALKKKLINSIPERNSQIESFNAFSSKQSEHVAGWTKMIKDWEAKTTTVNPYEQPKSRHRSEADIRHTLFTAESEMAEQGVLSIHEVSPCSFMTAGLELEEQQRRLLLSIRFHPATTTLQKTELITQRTKLSRGIARFRNMQITYMPISIQVLNNRPVLPQDKGEQPEAVPLFLPSALSEQQVAGGCISGLAEIEQQLREAQCVDSLEQLRNHLHIKARLITHKGLHVRHQGPSTRARSLITRNDLKIRQLTVKYQAARAALLLLSGGDESTLEWEVLKEEDVRCMEDSEELVKRAKREHERQLRRDRAARNEPEPGDADADNYVPPVPKTRGESRTTISWLWQAAGHGSDNDAELLGGLHVEWCKGYARKHRTSEEVCLLKEEMRRVLESHEKKAQWWLDRHEGRVGFVSDDLADGIRAYANRQSHMHERFHSRFAALWTGYTDVAQVSLAPDGMVMDEGVGEDDDDDDDDDEELDADEIVDESGLYI